MRTVQRLCIAQVLQSLFDAKKSLSKILLRFSSGDVMEVDAKVSTSKSQRGGICRFKRFGDIYGTSTAIWT